MKTDAAREGCSGRARNNTKAIEDHIILNNLVLFVHGGIDVHELGVESRVRQQKTYMQSENSHFEATAWTAANWAGLVSADTRLLAF